MKIINTATGEEISSIITNHSMTIEEAIYCVGGEIINDVFDDRFNDEGDNVIIDGKRYYYEDLDMVWES